VEAVRAMAMESPGGSFGLVGGSPALRALRARIRCLAPLPTTVLLEGETGTGKGVAARALHRLSGRSRQPFIHVDCAALSASLFESELFGHERGAFTGATAQRPGRLEAAGEGTLFLDEVGLLGPTRQAKLLRVLQDHAYERVGGTRPLRLRARILAATNLDLRRAVAEGGFRADLYYRLRVARLRLPPLRERLEDLPALVGHALARLAPRLGVPRPRPTVGFLRSLAAYEWPGNVRELINLLEQLLALGGGPVLTAQDLLGVLAPPGDSACPCGPGPEALRIAAVLRDVGGNVSRAARRLALPRTTLRRRIRRYGLRELIPRD